MREMYNEFWNNPEKWKDEFVLRATSYSKDTFSPYAFIPLLLMCLYVRKQLKLVINIDLSEEQDILSFVHVVNNSHKNDEYSIGVRNKALISTLDNKDPLYETVCFFINERKKALNSSFYIEHQRFDIYECLSKAPIDFLIQNYTSLFIRILYENHRFKDFILENPFWKDVESHFELSKLMVQLLDIKKGVVVHPCVDRGYSFMALPQACEYTACLNVFPLHLHLAKLLWAYNEGCNIITWKKMLLDKLPGYQYDYLLWNAWLYSKPEDEERLKMVFNEIIQYVSIPGIKAAFLITNEFWLNSFGKKLLPYVHKIIFFKNKLTLAIFDRNLRDKERRVILIDEIKTSVIYSQQILQDVKDEACQYVLNEEETGRLFKMDIGEIVRKKRQMKLEKGKKNESLYHYITLKRLDVKDIDISTMIDSQKLSDTPYLPYITALDGEPLSNESFLKMKEGDKSILLDKKLLLVNIHNRNCYCPKIFDVSKGAAILPAGRSKGYQAFIISENIDAEYLVNEMKKDYFKEQLFPVEGYDENMTVDTFIQLYIQVPDCSTTIERQKNLYRAEKLEYIKELNKSLGYDMERMSANKGRAPLPNGTMLLNGKYRIEFPIGNGGFGKTYKATEFVKVQGRIRKFEIAIKEFFINSYQKRTAGTLMVETPCEKIVEIGKAQKKFMNEVNKIKQFSEHPHIVNVYDVFDENGTCYYTMEYVDGGSLLDYVEKTETCSLQEEEALKIIREVASALSEMHKHRMNHLDVKPENILMSEEGKAVLIDFGAAHKFSNDDEASSLLAITSGGFSPLEIGKINDFSPATDIYSLGATLYWVLTGEQPPREGLSERDEKPECISDKVWKVLCVALRTYREERPQSIEEFLALLD